MSKAHLYYATDTYCVWCWGFGPNLRQFVAENADRLEVEVVFGGLLLGDRVVAVGEKPRVKEGSKRVGELCHVEFGKGFFDAVDEGSTVLDSMIAARLFCALRNELGVGKGVEITHQLQYAWYWEGRDLHEAEVRADVASRLDADPAKVEAFFSSPESIAAAEADFQRRKDLEIKGYPSLLLETEQGLLQVGGPTSSPERLTYCFDKLLAGEVPEPDPSDDED